MLHRTVTTQITFVRPFRLVGVDALQPAGTYVVETEEELLQAVSFTAWHRLETVIRLPRQPDGPMIEQVVTVDPEVLEATLALDTTEGLRL
jgi:hypothetical protein